MATEQLPKDIHHLAHSYAEKLGTPTIEKPLDHFLQRVALVRDINTVAMAISDESEMGSLLVFALYDKTQTDQDSLRETSDEVQQAHAQLDRHLRTLTPPRSSSLWIMDTTGEPFSSLYMKIADRFSSNPFLVLGIEAESLNSLVIAQIKR